MPNGVEGPLSSYHPRLRFSHLGYTRSMSRFFLRRDQPFTWAGGPFKPGSPARLGSLGWKPAVGLSGVVISELTA